MKFFRKNRPQEDVAAKVVQILKTVLLVGRPYSAQYISRVLMGDDTFGLRKEAHRELETFAALEGEPFFKIEGLIRYLVKLDFLEINDPVYGTIQISDAGENYLNEPKPLWPTPQEISYSWFEVHLLQSLRTIRKEMATQLGLVPYELFNNYALECLVEIMPESKAEMDSVPALAGIPDDCRAAILDAVQETHELKARDTELGGMLTRSKSPSHQRVRKLFEEGKSLKKIAQAGEIKESTVKRYLMNLHQAGEVNILSWIESQIDPKDLNRATEYFQQANDGRLEPAQNTLKLDYDTLRLCRFYSNQLKEGTLQTA